MKHPLYNDPEYVAAIAEDRECDGLMAELKNRQFRAFKIIREKEAQFKLMEQIEELIQKNAKSNQSP